MQPSEKVNELVNNFCKYVKMGDKRVIEKYSLEEIRQATYQYSADSNSYFYKAMEDRIKELEEIKAQRRTAKEKWLDRLFGFITGIVVTLAGIYLKGC